MSKFLRTYRLTVRGKGDGVNPGRLYQFSDPLTCAFDVEQLTSEGVCGGTIQVYNLAPETRQDLEFDSAVNVLASGSAARREIRLEAGYVGGSLQEIFAGTVRKAFSYRDGGDVNTITQFEVGVGLDAVQQATLAYASGAALTAAGDVQAVAALLKPYGVALGAVGTLFDGGTRTRGRFYLGNAWEAVKRLCRAAGGYACINNQRVYAMHQFDALALPGVPLPISSSTGLLGTPRRTAFTVEVAMLFEPRLRPMLEVFTASSVNPELRGPFIAQRVRHRGTISGAVDEGVVTSATMVRPPEAIRKVVEVNG